MILLMKKTLKEEQVILFIEEADPTQAVSYTHLMSLLL